MFNQKNSKRKAIAAKIAEKTHTSSKRVIQDTLPYVRLIYKSNAAVANKLSKYFDFNNEEVAYLVS